MNSYVLTYSRFQIGILSELWALSRGKSTGQTERVEEMCRNLQSEHHGSPALQAGHSHPVQDKTVHTRMLSCVSERPGR